MDKLNKLSMPDVKSGTPQEKMNAVKKALQSLEMMTEAYNQIVPVINAKIDWLSEAEKVAKDDTQDKKIDELIAVNKMLLGRINNLESKNDELSRSQNSLDKALKAIKIPKVPSIEPLSKRIKALEDKPQYTYDDKALKGRVKALEERQRDNYDDSKLTARIDKLESKPDYKYDDKFLLKSISEITRQQDELARAQNTLNKEIKAIEIPKVPSIAPLRKRVKALEDKPQYVYDDRGVKDRIKKLESRPEYKYDDGELKDRIKKLEVKPQYDDKPLINRVAALESKPESPMIEKYDDSALLDKISDIEKSIESLDKRVNYLKRTYSEKWQQAEFERTKFQQGIGEQISAIETPQKVDLSGIEKRIGKLESAEHAEYDDGPVLKEIDSIKKELSDVKKSFNEIFE